MKDKNKAPTFLEFDEVGEMVRAGQLVARFCPHCGVGQGVGEVDEVVSNELTAFIFHGQPYTGFIFSMDEWKTAQPLIQVTPHPEVPNSMMPIIIRVIGWVGEPLPENPFHRNERRPQPPPATSGDNGGIKV